VTAASRVPVTAGQLTVEPRVAYPRLRKKRTVWAGRDEDKEDPGVWSVTCFTVRKGYRRRGITYHLAVATVGYARDRGAVALEAYPMVVPPGKEITWVSCTSAACRSSRKPASPRSPAPARAAS
jgi:hypothetical protein